MSHTKTIASVIVADSSEDLSKVTVQEQFETEIIIVAGRVVKNRFGVTTPL